MVCWKPWKFSGEPVQNLQSCFEDFGGSAFASFKEVVQMSFNK